MRNVFVRLLKIIFFLLTVPIVLATIIPGLLIAYIITGDECDFWQPFFWLYNQLPKEV